MTAGRGGVAKLARLRAPGQPPRSGGSVGRSVGGVGGRPARLALLRNPFINI